MSPQKKCKKCGTHDTHLSRCAGCNKVWYCGRDCQQRDWVEHVFHCNVTVTTAHHLALGVHKHMMSDHHQAYVDYGFDQVIRPEDHTHLFGLYTDLIKMLGVKPRRLHKWRTEGTLALNIKAEFEKLPTGSRGEHYSWFLEHENVLGPARNTPASMDDFEKNLFRVAWEFTCQPLGESLDAARAVFRTWPHEKRFCHELYGFLLSDLRITPVCIQYVAMGFCTCSNLLEEYRLHRAYQELIKKCTFLEFYDAFISYSMLRFLDSKGLAGGLPRHFASATALVRPAVWDLKRYAVYDNMQEPPVEPNPVVAATYGFVNANSKEEADLLKKTYQQYFESKDADPLELHNVCQYGRIYEHVDSVIRLKSKRLRRLMKNV